MKSALEAVPPQDLTRQIKIKGEKQRWSMHVMGNFVVNIANERTDSDTDSHMDEFM